MGNKIKMAILGVVGVLGLAAFAPAAKADEGWRGEEGRGGYTQVGERGEHDGWRGEHDGWRGEHDGWRGDGGERFAHFDRDRFERNRDWRFRRFERRPGVYYRNGWGYGGWGYRPYYSR